MTLEVKIFFRLLFLVPFFFATQLSKIKENSCFPYICLTDLKDVSESGSFLLVFIRLLILD